METTTPGVDRLPLRLDQGQAIAWLVDRIALQDSTQVGVLAPGVRLHLIASKLWEAGRQTLAPCEWQRPRGRMLFGVPGTPLAAAVHMMASEQGSYGFAGRELDTLLVTRGLWEDGPHGLGQAAAQRLRNAPGLVCVIV